MSVNMESEMDFDDKKFYMNYLDGLTDDMPDEFFRLAQVFELNLFEPVRIDGSSDIYAAYIMNDAVESFFVFEQPVITGTYKDIESEQIAGVEKLDDGYMLIVNQGGENVFTIKFVKLSITSTYFNYGCMGHFWVKGYEYLRQLEYQLAVIRDKYRFLGSSSCNEKELVFMRLADFPPVKKYRSVPKAYYVPYPDSIYPEAVSYLMETARSVGDRNMERMLKIYQKKPCTLRKNCKFAVMEQGEERKNIKYVTFGTEISLKSMASPKAVQNDGRKNKTCKKIRRNRKSGPLSLESSPQNGQKRFYFAALAALMASMSRPPSAISISTICPPTLWERPVPAAAPAAARSATVRWPSVRWSLLSPA